MYTYKSRYHTRAEVWYNDKPGDARSVDLFFYQQRSSSFPGPSWKYFHTYAIDLTLSAEQLLKRLNKDTAYKIRRGRDRDKIVFEECDAGDPADGRVEPAPDRGREARAAGGGRRDDAARRRSGARQDARGMTPDFCTAAN